MVYVISQDGKPLMPCSNPIARLLLKQGKAKVKKREPFTIKLTYETTDYTQDLTLGVDTGSGTIGTAVSKDNGDIVYISEIVVRNDITGKMTQRAKYRRNRRNSDEENNLITLCHACHKDLHNGKINPKLSGKTKGDLKYATQINSIRKQLFRSYPNAIETFGYVTKADRLLLGVDKEHYYDACTIATQGNAFTVKSNLYKKKCVSDGDLQKTKGVRSEQPIVTDKIYHMVAVKAELSDSAMNILYTICEKGEGCNQSDIYKLAGISRQTVNTAIHKLEKDGILFLEDGEGRNKTVYLTKKGKKIVCDKVKPLLDAEDAVMHSWTKQEREELVRLSKKYLDGIREKMKTFMEE